MALWRPWRGGPVSPVEAGPSRIRGHHSTRWARETPDPTASPSVRRAWESSWRVAAEGCGLTRLVYVAAGVTVSAPRVGGVRLDVDGRPVRATVEMLAGQRPADYRAAAGLLARALGCGRITVTELQGQWLALGLLPVDPLADPVPWLPDGRRPGFLALTEDGAAWSCPWEQRPHAVVQGQTGSGKSSWTYGQLAALAGRDDVLVVGVDPSGLLFRPWRDLPGASWRASGLGDGLTEARRVLRELCAELDRRLELLPLGLDVLPTDSAVPLLAVVLEEYAGLIRAAELLDRKVGAEVRGLVGRLLAEGRKVGIRCLLVLQRADATLVDGATRAQTALRLSFASESDGLRMLHPAGSVDAEEHALAAPGVAVATAPGCGTFRVRATFLDYARYCAVVAGTGTAAA